MLFNLNMLLVLTSCVTGLNILLTNDDSWASANIRATYSALKADGHDVLLVGPAVQQSGKGGTFVLPTTNITAPGGEFGSVPVGAPYFGQDQHNPDLFYFNGTPAATVLFGLDVIVPQHFGSKPVDLVVSGPNEGQNNGSFIFTTSGTVGATYASVERGLPAVAFSAGNSTHRSFTTNTGKKDDNLPTFGPGNDCTEPPFILTRLTGGATIDKISINSQTGFPTSSDLVAPGLNTPINGIISLPGETPTSAKCETAVSIFSVDYDAPAAIAAPIQAHLLPIIGSGRSLL